MPWFSIAWRLFRHEMRRGELTVIFCAITLSVASVFSLSLFSERLQAGLTLQAQQLFTADRILSADKAVPTAWLSEAKANNIQLARQIGLTSMLFANDKMSLVFVRAVDSHYPLKGHMYVAEQVFTDGQATTLVPAPGEIWLGSRLFQLLDVKLGEQVELGELSFTVTKVLVRLPDQGASLGESNPHIVINYADIEQTGLTGAHSRAWFSYGFVGSDDNLLRYENWLLPQLNSDLHFWRSVDDNDSWLSRTVDKAEQYFLLTSLLAIMLAAVAIAVAAQRYCQRHYDPVAIMKTIGASRQQIRNIFLLQMSFITMIATLSGLSLGYIGQAGLSYFLTEKFELTVSGWFWRPAIIAVMTGVCCAFLFSLYPLRKLFTIAPLRVLRRDLGSKPVNFLLNLIAGILVIFLLLWAYSDDLIMSLILFISVLSLVAILFVITFLLLRLAKKFNGVTRHRGILGAWYLAWARIQRKAITTSIQLMSFAIAIMLLLLVMTLRSDMLAQWRSQLPENTPNYFLANITSAELPVLQQHFANYGVLPSQSYPIVKGLLVSVNDEAVNTKISKETDDSSAKDKREGLGRELNLTWSESLPFKNEVIAGHWWQDKKVQTVSIEEKIAKRLAIDLGDKITFNIGTEVVTVTVASIRSVNWQTMQPNFYFIINPQALQHFSPTYITAFHLAKMDKKQLSELLRPFPTVSLIDIDHRVSRIQTIVTQVSVAIEFVFFLVVCASALVLVAQVQASLEERQQELAILRTLGAKGSFILQSVVFEFVIIGVIAGLIAALTNELALYLLQSHIFAMNHEFHFGFWLLAPVVGALVVSCLGLMTCWRLLRLPSMTLLRRVM